MIRDSERRCDSPLFTDVRIENTRNEWAAARLHSASRERGRARVGRKARAVLKFHTTDVGGDY